MALPEPERVAVAVVRAWVEPDGELRARITRTLDVHDGEEVVSAASTNAEIVACVADWLAAFEDVTRR
jgi:hypothetical protein